MTCDPSYGFSNKTRDEDWKMVRTHWGCFDGAMNFVFL